MTGLSRLGEQQQERLDACVARVLALAEDRPATLGSGRLVCVDGPAGSGKSTLALALARARSAARVVHMDALFEGWTGLPASGASVAAMLAPLAHDEPGRYRRWDWHRDGWAEEREVAPGSLLVLEGVGSGGRDWAALTTVLVWVEAPDPEERLRRGLARDGQQVREHWLRFAADEQAHHAHEGTRARADVVLSTG